jgi:hypothetical protein
MSEDTVVRLEATRNNRTFVEQINALNIYISPFKQMWPFYWLKAAAVHDPKSSIWRLCYFSLVGRWGDSKPIHEFLDEGKAVIAINQLIDATRAWEILTSLQTDGTVTLSPNVITSAVPAFAIPTFYWQESITFEMPKAVAEVAKPAIWKYLYVFERDTWTKEKIEWFVEDKEDNEFASEERIRQALQSELNERGLHDFERFTSTRLGLGYGGFGPTCSIRDFFYNLDLPLAVRIERGIPDRSANFIPLTIYCRRPLMLESLKVTVGNIWLSNAEALPIKIEVSVEDGWSVGEVTVPYNCGRVWFKFTNLAKALPYDIPIPTPEDQVTEVLGDMYHSSSTNDGKLKWRRHLLESDGADFEIALLNAIARFGIPVLFAGQLQDGRKTGGTATPGYDLMVLNHAKRRAILISAKGHSNNPSQEDCQKLLDAVAMIQEKLQGWYVTGIIACHATNHKLGLARKRTDLRVWSREDLEVLLQADKREAFDHLLWAPPGSQWLATGLGFMGR